MKLYADTEPMERIVEDALIEFLEPRDYDECERCGHLVRERDASTDLGRNVWGTYYLTICTRC